MRDGRAREFAEHGWDAEDVPDPQDPATREASVLRLGRARQDAHARMLDWYRALVALRRASRTCRTTTCGPCRRRPWADRLVVRRGHLVLLVQPRRGRGRVRRPRGGGRPVRALSEPERTETGLRLQPDDVAVVRVQGVRT